MTAALSTAKDRPAADKAKRHPVRAFIDDCLDVYLGWPFIAASEVLVAHGPIRR